MKSLKKTIVSCEHMSWKEWSIDACWIGWILTVWIFQLVCMLAYVGVKCVLALLVCALIATRE